MIDVNKIVQDKFSKRLPVSFTGLPVKRLKEIVKNCRKNGLHYAAYSFELELENRGKK